MDLHVSRPKSPDSSKAANDGPTAEFSAAVRVAQRRWNGNSRFDIYRAQRVRLTSILFGGGDWHWRLTGASGAVIADCGGYRDEAQCLAAVGALRTEAGLATISGDVEPEFLNTTIA